MKKVLLFSLSVLIGVLFSSLSFALTADFEGFIELANKQKIYTIHYKAPPNQPTLILLHGLTYTTKAWQKMVEGLVGNQFGVVIYDTRGMGKTLEQSGRVTSVIPIGLQADDLSLLMDRLQLPVADLCGLSYGGAIGLQFALKYPERVRNLILLAPYVKPLKLQDDYILEQVKNHHTTFPWDKRSEDEIYDQYLKKNIYQTYPIYEPVVNEHPWRLEAIFHMVQGVRKYVAKDSAAQLPNGKIHFVLAEKDQYVPRSDHEEFLNSLSASQKVSRLNVIGAEHKLPQAVPHFIASWVREIVLGNSKIAGGRVFSGDPKTGISKDGSDSLQLERD
jgi:pimeloyl-ACP methyl ester carboxylesterase